MRIFGFLLAVILTTSVPVAASDPFVGTWVYSIEKSPKPTITYEIRDLGQDRYALTGSSGETTEIKADGVPIKSPSGATVSFRKLGPDTWQMNRVDSRTLVRVYTVSADDKNLQLVDVYTAKEEGQPKTTTGYLEKTTTVYMRTSPGKSLFGSWRSISMDDKVSAPPGSPDAQGKLIIAPYGSDGLSFTSTVDKHRTDMRFDGKQYVETAPDGPTDESSSGRRVSDRVIEIQNEVKGKPESNTDFRVSDDGKTLTITDRPVKAASVFTSVWEKQ